LAIVIDLFCIQHRQKAQQYLILTLKL